MQTRASSSQGQNDPLSPSPAQGTQIPALPAPPAPTHCLRQAPGSQGLAEPHPTQLRIFIVLSLPSPVQAPQGSAPWLFISLGSLLQIQIKAMYIYCSILKVVSKFCDGQLIISQHFFHYYFPCIYLTYSILFSFMIIRIIAVVTILTSFLANYVMYIFNCAFTN